jgi:hypothetical protein
VSAKSNDPASTDRADLRRKASDVGARMGAGASRLVDNWVSVPTWFTMMRKVGLTDGTPLQRLIEKTWYASR